MRCRIKAIVSSSSVVGQKAKTYRSRSDPKPPNIGHRGCRSVEGHQRVSCNGESARERHKISCARTVVCYDAELEARESN